MSSAVAARVSYFLPRVENRSSGMVDGAEASSERTTSLAGYRLPVVSLLDSVQPEIFRCGRVESLNY